MKKSLLLKISIIVTLLLSVILYSGFTSQRERRISQWKENWSIAMEHKDLGQLEQLMVQWPDIRASESIDPFEIEYHDLKDTMELVTLIDDLMVSVPQGTLLMGSNWGVNEELNDEAPVHRVELSAFQISKYEISNVVAVALLDQFPQLWYVEDGYLKDAQWNRVILHLDDNHSKIKAELVQDNIELLISPNGKSLPICEITWYGAAFLCNLMNRLNGLEDSYNLSSGELISSHGYRLPSEAQWEWAASAGAERKEIYSGGDQLDQVAWYWENAWPNSREVGGKMPNGLGIYDMTGNLYEWCGDWYSFHYYEESVEQDPLGPEEGFDRVIRGGSFADLGTSLNITFRFFRSPNAEQNYIGFRPVYIPENF